MKSISIKQAEKWLQKLKSQNQQSYKDITKFLRKYEMIEDKYDCYVKINQTLLPHIELTKQLNGFLEPGNKFIVNKPEDQKIKQLVGYVKKKRPQIFEKIWNMVQQFGKSTENNEELNMNFKPRLHQICGGDKQLEKITEEALDLSGEELINRKNLDYLKGNKTTTNQIEQQKDGNKNSLKNNISMYLNSVIKKNDQRISDSNKTIIKRQNRPQISINLTPIQEKLYFKKIEKELDQKQYNSFIKLVQLYYLNVITKRQLFQLISFISNPNLQIIKQILESRQADRRKNSIFRPLNDVNFNHYARASPSYVTVPYFYPIKSSHCTSQNRQVLNTKWISVPHGSQEHENFSVRNKNQNQINLLKAEDQRYEFDVYMLRLKKSVQILDKTVQELSNCSQADVSGLLKKVIDLGILQIYYKLISEEKKKEFQFLLFQNPLEACKMFKNRFSTQISELNSIKNIHSLKNWTETANKNFYKALDIKGFQFKKNERQKIKNSYFLLQMQQKVNRLTSKYAPSQNIMHSNLLQKYANFFEILNSFSSVSKTQKCNSRTYPKIQDFNIQKHQLRPFYPSVILAFQNQAVRNKVYSFIIFFIENSQIAEFEKQKCKVFLQQLFVNIMKWDYPTRRGVTTQFNEEKLYLKIANIQNLEIDIINWIFIQSQPMVLNGASAKDEKQERIFAYQDEISQYSYYPIKSETNTVLYGSQFLFTFLRFVYVIYERLIKMKEVVQNQSKLDLFELLFYACIRTKQGLKFEENLNLIFGKSSYLFLTIYKHFDNLLKNLLGLTNCLITNHSLKLMKETCQSAYFILLNRYCLSNNLTNNKLVRLTYEVNDKICYFNYLQSYYKAQDNNKEMLRKRIEVNREIEYFTVEDLIGMNGSKKVKLDSCFHLNNLEYLFQENTIKMVNLSEKEDVLTRLEPKQSKHFMISQLQRLHLFQSKVM